ncbi:MAG: YycH family regulatory protein [Ectobacillus sp.]
MNFENFKTVLLINLVTISLFLTYNLWTYQPDSSSSQKQKYIQDTPENQKKDIPNLLFPSRIIVHTEGKHLASEQSMQANSIYRALVNGEFHSFRDISYKYRLAKNEFLSFVHGRGKIEILFPSKIPFSAAKNIFSIEDKGLENYKFDRIILNAEGNQEGDVRAYFISYGERKVYEMALRGVELKELHALRDQFVEKEAKEYFMYRLTDTYAIFLPQNSLPLAKMLYVIDDIEEDSFKNTLFTDMRYVKKDVTDSEEVYTDGTRLLRIHKATQLLDYINSSVATRQHVEDELLLQQGIDFINSHGGWTDSYRFYSMNSENGELIFRLFIDSNYPVFSGSGLATLRQTWGVEELSTYKRPLFKLTIKEVDDKKVELPSGKIVANLLDSMPDAAKRDIKDIAIGYEMNPEVNVNTGTITAVKIEPIWYISYEKSHRKIEWDSLKGGEFVGLE